MTRRRVRGVLFDAAGTLIRPRVPVGETYSAHAKAPGAAVSAWRLDDAFRRVMAKAPPMAFPEVPPAERPERERDWWRRVVRQTFLAADSAVRPADFEALFDGLFRHYAAPEAWQVCDGAAEALRALRASGRVVAVVSNFDGRLPALLDGLGLGDLLDGVFLPGDTGAAKPDPAIFQAAARRLDLSLADCVYVGDHPEQDVAAARSVGMGAIDVGELATLADLPKRIDDVSGPAA
ncbi:MAG: HAD-IA family hydrolase [Myxococcota bacterium]